MSARNAADEATTYLLESADLAEVVDLVQVLRARGIEIPARRPALVDDQGGHIELPGPEFDALVQVVTAMAQGQGVTIAPHNAMLTTQEAGDFLGISRPTLVKLLETDEIPFERRGRHRRVRLSDLLGYQERSRGERRRTLDEMAHDAEDLGLYEATAGPPPEMR
jgi:excisionase family DNA binding protein